MAKSKFIITADRDPQTLCRLIDFFARQDRLIDCVAAVALPCRQRIVIEVSDFDDHRAGVVAEKMRQMISVRSVQHRVSRSHSS